MIFNLKRRREQFESIKNNIYKRFLSGDERKQFEARVRKNAFITVFDEKRWGEQPSGGGSTIQDTRIAREIVAKVIRDFKIQSMVDLPCGDFAWMPLVLKDLPSTFQYLGGDIVPSLIEKHRLNYPQYKFEVIDFVKDVLPRADLIFTRDALQHLPLADIETALINFSRSGCKYLLTTTHLRQTCFGNARNIRVGRCRDRNLLLKPFNLADPIVIYSEQHPGHKFLGLWQLPLKDKP